MAEKLTKYYEMVGEKGGLQAKMRLAMKTAVPSTKAGGEPDSPELLDKFHAAVEEILGASVAKL